LKKWVVRFMQDLPRCSRCALPITWETLSFGEDGVCNVCKNWETKKSSIDWNQREAMLVSLLDTVKAKKAEYDCIVPFSGGKDSTFTLLTLVRKYKLRPLVVSFDHGFYRPKMVDNRTRTFRRLGVDVITFTPNWQVVRKMMLEALVRKGDFCWHCHTGVYAYPMQIAVKFKIPLVIWGEGGGEYESYFKYEELEEMDEWKFNRRIILGIRAEDMAGFINEDISALAPFLYPSKQEIDAVGIKSIQLGNYLPWNVQKQVQLIQDELGWEMDTIESGLPGNTYEKIECMLQGVRDYVKYLKRGFSRVTHLTTLDIRHGRMTRDEALTLIQQLEGNKPRSLQVFLEYVGLTEAEFHAIVLDQVIPPAVPIDPNTLPEGAPLWDQEAWFRDPEAANRPAYVTAHQQDVKQSAFQELAH
jgi:N-acetyl sugar amidotransferase